jgi:hypothetical protein
MRPIRTLAFVIAALAATACSSDVAEPVVGSSEFRVINATQGPVDVLVDGQAAVRGLRAASLSTNLRIGSGSHQVRLTSSTGATTTLTVDGSPGRALTTVVYPDTALRITAAVLQDTGAVVPAGKSKLRVVHMAANVGPIDIWRTQPDFPTPVLVMFPFVYRAMSSYIQSDPGSWEVWVTPVGSNTRLATTGPITVPSGERRTVVLLDSAGVARFQVIQN